MGYPMPPPPAPRRTGLPTWAKILIVCAVLFVVGLGVATYLAVRLFTSRMSSMMEGGPLAPQTAADKALFVEGWKQPLTAPPSGPNALPPAMAGMFSFPSSVTTYDLDGDGVDEVMVTNMFGTVSLFEDDGAPIRTLNVGELAIAVGGRLDGEATLFTAERWGTSVEAYRLDGVMVWSYGSGTAAPALPEESAGGASSTAAPYGVGISCVSVVDVNDDGEDEVLIAYQGPPAVQCIAADAGQKVLWQYGAIGGVSDLGCGDVDGDGKTEILAVDPSGAVHVLDGSGALKMRWNLMAFQPTLAVADMDGDGRAEVLLRGGASVPGQTSNTVSGLDSNGRALWSHQVLGQGMMSTMGGSASAAAADLNGDGTRAWVVAGGDGSLNVISADGGSMQTHNTGVRIKGIAALRPSGESTDWIVATTSQEVIAYRPVAGKF